MDGSPDIDLIVAISREIGWFHETHGDAGGKHFPVPGTVIIIDNIARVLIAEDSFHASADDLVRLMVATRRHGISLLAIFLIAVRIPISESHAFDQLTADAIAFD